MIDYAIELGYTTLALTDHECISGHIKAQAHYREIKEKNPNFKLILGNEIYLVRNGLTKENYVSGQDKFWHFLLLARDPEGHKQIREISTRAWKRSWLNGRMRRVPTYYQDLIDIIDKNKGHIIGSTACFLPGQKVRVANGEKNIEDITNDDIILTADGEWEKINFPTSREYNGRGFIIEITREPMSIKCTEDHQFLVLDHGILSWKPAKELKKNDKLVEPIPPVKYTNDNTINIKDCPSIIEYRRKTIGKQNYQKTLFRLPNTLELTNEAMRTLGLWLADGHISYHDEYHKREIGFTFADKEFDIYYSGFVEKGLIDLGLRPEDIYIHRRPENHRVDVSINKVEFCLLFMDLFDGICHANNKYIPKRLLHLSKELDEEFFFGYMLGDGYFRYRSDKNAGEVVAASISKQLIRDMERLASSFGLSGSITIAKAHKGKDGTSHQESYYLTYSNAKLGRNLTKERHIGHQELINIIEESKIKRKGFEDFVLIGDTSYRIKKIKSLTEIKIQEPVYCLNTPSHNFVLNNVVVHNCLGSYVAQLIRTFRFEELEKWLRQMVRLFGEGNFYLELQPPKELDNEQDIVNRTLVTLSSTLNIPYIVTNDSHYAKKEDAAIHKAYLNSQDGEREVDEFYATTYMMDTEELEGYFKGSGIDLQVAYKNIQTIADSCEDYDLRRPLKIPRLTWKEFHPVSSVESWYDRIPQLKNFYESDYEGDVRLAEAIVEKLESDSRLQIADAYSALDENLDMTWQSSIVNKTHWSAYFLNLQNIIQCCWDAGSLVGPSRGSGLGFLLLYILGITQINPLWETTRTYSWRFLNPSRVSVLDVDLDIEGNRRDIVLQHLREVYGEDRVSNVATFGTEGSKASILTAARGLDIDVDEAQYIASFVPADRGIPRTLSQCYYGDEKEGFKPIAPFVQEMNRHKELWEVAQKIEGLICRLGSHAGGVIFVDEPFTESTGLMRTPDGTIVTAYELHTAEDVSLIKYDLLSIEALDKIHVCLDLLIEAGYIEKKATLKETYENAIGIYTLERNDPEMWKMIHEHKVLSVFQLEKQSGVQGIALVKPTSVDDLAVLNAALRLMAQEKGGEAPLNKFARFKNDISQWYKEMDSYGLTKQEQEILKKELSISSGMCVLQEQFMRLVQIPECGGFDLEWSDRLRKSIAKKNPKAYKELTEEYFEETKKKGLSENLCNYVWSVLIAMNKGYGFNAAHTLAYSLVALQEMNLAYKYPIIYWNTANLIVDSGGEGSSTDYRKIAQSVNRIRQAGINISLVDINHSALDFKPDEEHNRIMYGLKALTNINDDFVREIENGRPYVSLVDFVVRTNPKRPAMISLIKGGAFDQFVSRQEAMVQYLWLKCDKKKNLNLQNMPGLIRYGLLPEGEEYLEGRRVYEFNRYLKAECKGPDGNYKLTPRAIDFLEEVGYDGLIEPEFILNAKTWDNIYQERMDLFRNWIKENKEELLRELNTTIFMQDWEKYASGNISSWEMEALCFYYHEHELAHLDTAKYGVYDFFKLPENPIVEKTFKHRDAIILIYKLFKIAGTAIAKNKDKSTVYILTTSGVVPVKFRKEYFALFDRQIFRKNPDGSKTIIERSWFNKGSMIMIQGIRRGDEFIAKKYARSGGHQLYHIDEIAGDGSVVLRSERKQGEEEEDNNDN